jgi:mannose-6-phosphate isomerase-like protein (cupin superfamily)
MKHKHSWSAALALVALLALPASVLAQAAPDMKTMASSADVNALIAKAKAMPPKPLISQNIVGTGMSRASLEYRAGPPSPAAIHDTENELMYVIQGGGTLVMGGSLVDGKRSNPTNQSGSSITGGNNVPLVPGTFIIVAAGVPHQITADAGGAVVLMTFHTPAGTPTPAP